MYDHGTFIITFFIILPSLSFIFFLHLDISSCFLLLLLWQQEKNLPVWFMTFACFGPWTFAFRRIPRMDYAFPRYFIYISDDLFNFHCLFFHNSRISASQKRSCAFVRWFLAPCDIIRELSLDCTNTCLAWICLTCTLLAHHTDRCIV